MKSKNYYFRTKENTQEFPDFLLSESDSKDFLELKAFNANASPAFDIANFDAYCTSLFNNYIKYLRKTKESKLFYVKFTLNISRLGEVYTFPFDVSIEDIK